MARRVCLRGAFRSRCAAQVSARSSISRRVAGCSPHGSHQASWHRRRSLRPSSSTSPKISRPSTCHVQPPSHLPVVGRTSKLHGQPQSQLHATRTLPLSCQLSAIISLRSSRDAQSLGGAVPVKAVGDPHLVTHRLRSSACRLRICQRGSSATLERTSHDNTSTRYDAHDSGYGDCADSLPAASLRARALRRLAGTGQARRSWPHASTAPRRFLEAGTRSLLSNRAHPLSSSR